jgi:hypothetical protein
MAFADQIRKFARTMETDSRAAFVGACELSYGSIRDGSATTGAPPLPVDTRALYNSVQLTFAEDGTAMIATDSPYAIAVEDGLHGAVFHNGGPHGWALTVAGWDRIVDKAALQVVGSAA